MTDNRKGSVMLMRKTVSTNRMHRWVPVLMAALSLAVLGGCCTTTFHTVAIVSAGGQDTCCPDDSNQFGVRVGEKVSFVNTTGRECTVTATNGAYDEGNVFTVKKCGKKVMTVAGLAVGAEITHVIDCEGNGHGAPQMIVEGGTPRVN